MTDETFHAHWRHPHGTLTRRIPQIHAYVQNHGIGPNPALAGLASSGHQGVPAIKVVQLSDLNAMFGEPDYKPLQEDALLLYDQNDVIWLVTREKTVRRPQDLESVKSPYNALMFLRRSSNCQPSEFPAHVDRFAASLCNSADASCGCRISLPDAGYYAGKDAPPIDAVVELLFKDHADFERIWHLPSNQGLIAAALRDWVEPAGTRGMLAQEERFF